MATSVSDRLAAIAPAMSGFLPFHEGSVIEPTKPSDDWHVDPVVKEAAKVSAEASAEKELHTTKKNAKRKPAAHSDGKASIIGASFNLSNAVRPEAAMLRDRSLHHIELRCLTHLWIECAVAVCCVCLCRLSAQEWEACRTRCTRLGFIGGEGERGDCSWAIFAFLTCSSGSGGSSLHTRMLLR